MIKRTILTVLTLCILFTFEIAGVNYTSAQSPESKFIQVVTINDRIIALKADGTLWQWFYPKESSLYLNSVKFIQIKGLSDIKSVAANESFCLVLKKDGTVWGWGDNTYGQLGDGTSIKRNIPVKAKNISKIKDIAISSGHAIALREDGSVWVWGNSGYGMEAVNGSVYLPVKVKELSMIKSVSTWDGIFTVLKGDGTVWSWACDSVGENLLGYTPFSHVPRQVPNISGAVAVSTGYQCTVVLRKDGKVYIWGNDSYILNKKGYISSGNIKKYEVTNLNSIKKIYAGCLNVFAVKNDGTLWSWGENNHGQLGTGNINVTDLPVKSGEINNVIQISSYYDRTVFLKSDGSIWLCGYKSNPEKAYNVDKPIDVTGINEVKGIAATDSLSVALKKDGTVCMWGYITFNNWKDRRYFLHPEKIKGMNNIIAIKAGDSFITALKNDRTVWAMGLNTFGQLGDCTLAGQTGPVKVPGLDNIIEISSGYDYTLALKNDGSVWGFGGDELHKLDSPTPPKTNFSEPKRIDGLNNIKKVDTGYNYAIVLGVDGSLWCWSYSGITFSFYSDSEKILPKKVEGINDIADIKNGAILKGDGSVWVINSKYLPVKVNELTSIKTIFKNDFNSIYAVDESDNLWNLDVTSYITSQSNSKTSYVKREVLQINFNEILDLESRLILKNDGKVSAWGNNEYGQAGNGDCSFIVSPVKLY